MAELKTRLLILLVLVHMSTSFYLPGVVPREFKKLEMVWIKSQKLVSNTQLPFEYYSLPFCRPQDSTVAKAQALNLGELLRGDRIYNTPYNVVVGKSQECKILCAMEYDADQTAKLIQAINEDVTVFLLLDGLPVAVKHIKSLDDGSALKTYTLGFPLGVPDNVQTSPSRTLHNHLSFSVWYDLEADTGIYRIVGFEVEPDSILRKFDSEEWRDEPSQCQDMLSTSNPKCQMATCQQSADREKLQLTEGRPSLVIWTYDVIWKPSPIPWTSRWDTYLRSEDDSVHWFGVLNAAVVALFLTGIAATVLVRVLRKDVQRYRLLDDDFELSTEGWKLVSNDVFRPPPESRWLCVLVGSGAQVLSMLVEIVCAAVLGFISPEIRGGLTEVALFLFAFMGVIAGFVAALLSRFCRHPLGSGITFRVATVVPGLSFLGFLGLNCIVWARGSTGALPFGTLVGLFVMWWILVVPSAYVGALLSQKTNICMPMECASIPRQSPPLPSWMRSGLPCLCAGFFPFLVMAFEFPYILSSILLHKMYYLFGFVFIVFTLLIVTCAEVSVIVCYLYLSHEDYQWWWRSFFSCASAGLYVLVYSVHYYVFHLPVHGGTAAALFLGYMVLFSMLFALAMGSVGFLSSLLFVRKIYSAIKTS